MVEECVGWSGRMLSLQGLGTSRYSRQTVLAITHTWSMSKEVGNSLCLPADSGVGRLWSYRTSRSVSSVIRISQHFSPEVCLDGPYIGC